MFNLNLVIMPKVKPKSWIRIYDLNQKLLFEELVFDSEVKQRLMYYIQLHLEIGFNYARIFRIEGYKHILYEFRDIRSIPNNYNI